jgi:hypothetical protein
MGYVCYLQLEEKGRCRLREIGDRRDNAFLLETPLIRVVFPALSSINKMCSEKGPGEIAPAEFARRDWLKRNQAEKIRPATTREQATKRAGPSRHLSRLFFSLENLMHFPLLASSANRLIISIMFFLTFTSPVVLAQAPQPAGASPGVETIMKSMLSAILANSLTDFVSSGDEAFQAGMTKEMLSSINQSLASRLKQGYTTTFLTTLRQQGFDVYVWKLVFKDGNDDVLIFMALKDKKVGGFWLR